MQEIASKTSTPRETGSETAQEQASGPVIRVQNLSKVFKLYAEPVDRLKESLHPLRKQYHRKFYALDDVSFEVHPGETVGIVGRNGSGKSTLLKVITGVLTPSAGTCHVRGRVSAILELGSGFNPELSGLENVYFSGMLMGYEREEMDELLDPILSFADIGDFVHQPVKTYSSGMMVRLAFSVQTMVRSQIMIIDEALAVGDEAFQRKCFSRLEKLRQDGCTLLYVSHAAASVISLCNRALLLHKGGLLLQGRPKFVVSHYQRLAHAPAEELDEVVASIACAVDTGEEELQTEPGCEPDADNPSHAASPQQEDEASYDPNLTPDSTEVYPSQGAEIRDMRITTAAGETVNILQRGMIFHYRYAVHFFQDCRDVRFGMQIKNIQGFPLGGATSHPLGQGVEVVKKGSIYAVSFTVHCRLAQGSYFLNAGVEGSPEENQYVYLHRILDAAMFRVEEPPLTLVTGTVDFGVTADFTLLERP